MNPIKMVREWFTNRTTSVEPVGRSPQIKPIGTGIVMPEPLPPSSMTFPNTTYNKEVQQPALQKIYKEAGY